MTTFSRFQDEFLVAAYDLSERTGEEMVETGEIIAKYPLTHRSNWIMRSLFDLKDRGLVNDMFTHDDELKQSVWLTAAGMREAEQLIENGVVIMNAEDFAEPELVAAVSEQVILEAKIIPASDRHVILGDNLPRRTEIVSQIVIAEDAIRSSNKLEAGEKADAILSLSLGRNLIEGSKRLTIGAIRYLILERIKKAFESIIEDVIKVALVAAFVAIATVLLTFL